MKVAFRFDEGKAQVFLSPTDTIDESNLSTLKQYGDRSVKFKTVEGKELIIEFDKRIGHEVPDV